jgi:hypothetical protein
MKMSVLRTAIAAMGVAVALASCESAPPPAPPPPPPPPPVALSPGVIQAAAAYQTYVRDASTISATFADPESIQSALRRGVAYESRSFSKGIVAWGAVVALQEPTFVKGVRDLGLDAHARGTLANRIMADPSYAAQLPGAPAAAGLIVASLQADGAAVHKAGAAVKQSAYDVQRQKWSREFVKERDARLASAKTLSATPISASADITSQLSSATQSGQGLGLTAITAQPPYTETVVRSLAIAALAALGAADGANSANVEQLMNESIGSFCLNLGKLNLYQCLAVSKPHYEDVFCLGQHALMDTGQCLSKVAGAAQPAPSPALLVTQPGALDATTTATPAVQSGPAPNAGPR